MAPNGWVSNIMLIAGCNHLHWSAPLWSLHGVFWNINRRNRAGEGKGIPKIEWMSKTVPSLPKLSKYLVRIGVSPASPKGRTSGGVKVGLNTYTTQKVVGRPGSKFKHVGCMLFEDVRISLWKVRKLGSFSRPPSRWARTKTPVIWGI